MLGIRAFRRVRHNFGIADVNASFRASCQVHGHVNERSDCFALDHGRHHTNAQKVRFLSILVVLASHGYEAREVTVKIMRSSAIILSRTF